MTVGGGTVKLTVVLLEIPPAVTFTAPEVAVAGTVAVINPLDHPVIVAFTLLKVTDPCVVPNPLPLICTDVLYKPLVGLTLLTATAPTVKDALLLLLAPPTVTLIGPVVADAGTAATICVSFQIEVVA